MSDPFDFDLSDPTPPIPGAAQRAAVSARAGQLARRHRMMQGAGAFAAVALLVVGLSVVTLGGGSSGTGSQRVEVANTPPGDAVTSPTTATVSGTAAVPAGATLTLRFTGPGGTYTATADAGGAYSLDGLTPGDYEVVATLDTPGTDTSLGSALQVARATVTLVSGANSYDPSF